MTDMNHEKILPIKWAGWDKVDELFNSYYKVEFTDNFGNFKKGEKYSSISIDYGKGIIEAYNDSGNDIVKKQNWKAVAIETE